MIARNLYLKETVYFIHPTQGSCAGTIRDMNETHAVLQYKVGSVTEYITMPIAELSLNPEELTDKVLIEKWDGYEME